MNKEIYISNFTETAVHSYRCPSCHSGTLKILGKLQAEESAETKALHQEDWFEVDYVKLNFSCTLCCANCAEHVFVVGDGKVREYYYPDDDEPGGWGREYVQSFSPKFFQPSLQLIDYAANTPSNVVESLNGAASVYFSNPSACCNNIRIAAEEVLTTLGIPEVCTEKSRRLNFKSRIEMLPAERQEVVVLFDALRWLGNHGSHPGDTITKEDALQAFELMELLLEELFSDRRRQLQDLAKAINDAKGPVSRSSKSDAEPPL